MEFVLFMSAHERVLPAVRAVRCRRHERIVAPPNSIGRRDVRSLIRQILAEDHGVDISRIKWVTFEEAHVAEFLDPPNVERAPAGKDITAMLKAGEIDAAILGAIPTDPLLKPVIANPDEAGKRWGEKHAGAIQLNHLAVVKNSERSASSPATNADTASVAMTLDTHPATGNTATAVYARPAASSAAP